MVVTLWRLEFSDRLDYSRYESLGFALTLSLGPDNQILIKPQLDTGSTFCVFQRQYAEILGLRTEQGVEQRIRTATGSFTAYGHEITLAVGQLEWQAVVYFAGHDDFPINVVGRLGFLDRLRVGIVDYEEILYLSGYEQT
jgi:hypothetical protein